MKSIEQLSYDYEVIIDELEYLLKVYSYEFENSQTIPVLKGRIDGLKRIVEQLRSN